MKRAIAGAGRRLTYANVMVTLLALGVLGGGGAYALSSAPGAKPADLSVSISGPPSVVTQAGGPRISWHETVQVHNSGPGRTRPVVLVGAPGRAVNSYNQAADNDQASIFGTVLDIARSSSKCVPLGAELDIQGIPSRSGPLACEGPLLASGKSASFVIAYLSFGCAGAYTMTTTALATSALVDPNASHDRASRAVSISNTGGCG
jgi:hypothetical protein